MRLALCAVALVWAGCQEGPAAPASPPEPTVVLALSPFGAAWAHYLDAPTPALADSVRARIPSERDALDEPLLLAALGALQEMERRVAKGDTLALSIAFALSQVGDGHLGEELAHIQDRGLSAAPAPWLRLMQAAGQTPETVARWASDPGRARYDGPDAIRDTLTRRRDALQALDAPDVAALRDRAVAALDAELAALR